MESYGVCTCSTYVGSYRGRQRGLMGLCVVLFRSAIEAGKGIVRVSGCSTIWTASRGRQRGHYSVCACSTI